MNKINVIFIGIICVLISCQGFSNGDGLEEFKECDGDIYNKFYLQDNEEHQIYSREVITQFRNCYIESMKSKGFQLDEIIYTGHFSSTNSYNFIETLYPEEGLKECLKRICIDNTILEIRHLPFETNAFCTHDVFAKFRNSFINVTSEFKHNIRAQNITYDEYSDPVKTFFYQYGLYELYFVKPQSILKPKNFSKYQTLKKMFKGK